MRAIDAAAPEPVQVLIDRAGAAVARSAVDLLGGTYGRRVVVVAGPGNNGADGRAAARRLTARGVRTTVFDVLDAPPVLPACDLVIDAALGTGVSRAYSAPDPGSAAVLAVDVPSGIHGDTGRAMGSPMVADVTVTFAAAKPGLYLGDGPDHCGEVHVVDIGLDVSATHIHLLTGASAAALVPGRSRDSHKWRRAGLVVAGSPGMTGAASLVAEAALRAGCGMVLLASPGVAHSPDVTREVVSLDVDASVWADELLEQRGRVHAAAVGPGLGSSMVSRHQIRSLVRAIDKPVVVDGDGLGALGGDAAVVLGDRPAPTVLTPHDGEFAVLCGGPPGDDRILDVASLAAATGSVVVAKGPTTVVAAPSGEVRLVTTGDQRLATAGTGDVLTGIVLAYLAAGLPAVDAAALAAYVHGVAGTCGPTSGVVASDLVDALPTALAAVAGSAASP